MGSSKGRRTPKSSAAAEVTRRRAQARILRGLNRKERKERRDRGNVDLLMRRVASGDQADWRTEILLSK